MKTKSIISGMIILILILGLQACGKETSKEVNKDNSKEKVSSVDTKFPDDTTTSDEDKIYLLSTIVATNDILKDGYVSDTEITSIVSVMKNIKATTYGESNKKISKDMIIIMGQIAKVSKDIENGKDVSNEKSIISRNINICLNNYYLKNYKTKNFASIESTVEELLKGKITFDANSTFKDITEIPLA